MRITQTRFVSYRVIQGRLRTKRFYVFFSQNIRMDRKSCSTTRRFVGQSPFPDGVKVGVPLHSCCERGRATIRLGSRNARTMTHKPQYTSPTSQRTEHAGHMSPAHFCVARLYDDLVESRTVGQLLPFVSLSARRHYKTFVT